MKRWIAWLCAAALMVGCVPFASAQEDTASTDEEVRRMLSGYTSVWTNTDYEGLITQRIPHTALLGNGDVGVASAGDDYAKSFYLSKGDFWGYKDGPKAIGTLTLRPAEEVVLGDVSLARGATVNASTKHENYTPERVVSGKAGPGYEGWVSQIGNPQWIELDLKQVKSFDRVVIAHASSAGVKPSSEDTRAFSVSVRNSTGENWKTIYETADNRASTTEIVLEERVSARYLRLDVVKGTQETTDDTRTYPRARIVQIELFDSTVHTEPSGPPPTSHFREEQDILNAVIRTEMDLDGVAVAMDTRLMEGDNLLVTKLTSLGDADAALIARLWAKDDNGVLRQTATAKDGQITVTRTLPKSNAGDPASYTTAVALSTRVVGAAATAAKVDNAAADLAFTLPAGGSVYIVTAIGGGGKTYDYQNKRIGPDPTAQASALLEKADAAEKIAALDEIRAAWWDGYWAASSIRLDTADERLALLQKYYYNAQYELGCNIRQGKVAPGLYGLWHTTDNASWRSDYHLNYNFVASFYGVATANRPAQLLPAIDAIVGYVPSGPSNAATLRQFGSESGNAAVKAFVDAKFEDGTFDPVAGIEGGVLFPVGIGPWGMNLDSKYWNQTFNAAFSAYPLVQYYEATRDETFLRQVLYPYLKPILTFLRAWVVENERGGYDIYSGYNEGSWARNSAGELGVYRLCLKYAVLASETLGLDEDLRADWLDLQQKLAPFPTQMFEGNDVYALAEQVYADGQWSDWSKAPDRLNLESIFPGLEFGYYSSPEELRRMHNTMAYIDKTNQWNGINTFPEMFTQALWIRYDSAVVVDRLAANIRRMIQPNGMIDDTVHGLEKAGATEAIHSMLLQQDKGVIKAFPAWLSDKDAAFTDLRAAGAFLVSGSYSGDSRQVTGLQITSLEGQPLSVASPWEGAVITDSRGKRVAAKLVSAPNHPDEPVYTFSTVKGETYTFTKGEPGETFDPLLGDVDQDGDVDAADALTALQIATGKIDPTDVQTACADADKDGFVTAADALRILQFATGKIAALG
ncbi:MAG: discoidin domain-containing protein [Acutalibacteraceae bacterium]